MGKELVISANRHETKAAILEDDQLVEIYFQRANEYSLAGSIHKGRVTRVLPGMQSAFVNIGLERDAFLYVSDFFEENEEYDRIAADEKGRIAERPEPAPAANLAERETPAEQSAEAENRDRKGRRSRRRRSRGRGFPETKYAAEAGTGRSRQVETEAEPPKAQRLELLPGESLAKYKEESEHESARLDKTLEQVAGSIDEIQEVAEATAESIFEEDLAREPGGRTNVQAESIVREEVSETNAEEDHPEEPETTLGVDSGTTLETATQGNENGEQETIGEMTEGTSGSAFREEETVEPSEEEVQREPSEARVELRADLRERGSRYPHRVSRRVRRKLRNASPAEAQPEQAAEEPVTEKAGPSIADLLREGQEILVQVAKEPLGQKGARITSHIALPGRYVVYMPTVDHLGVSRKISSEEERMRLKRILQTHRVGIPGGFIVRTAGSGKSEKEIAADVMFLYNLWLDIRQKAERRPAPALIHHDLDLVQRLLRDQLTEGFKAIWTDNEEVYERVLQFVERLQPSLVGRVKMYTRSEPIFDVFNITAELEKALRPKVWLKSGGYIVVNQTEALVAIDVNTGKYVGKSTRLEDTIVKTNVEAIKEIVRQIRLRDLGGIIVIDFIDMDERKNRQKVMQALEEEMRSDRAPYKLLQFNDFGLVAITRKRVKQSLERTLCAPCPCCEGAGYVKSVQTVISEILQEANKIANVVEGPNVVLRVHPDIARVLKSTDNDYLEELEETLRRPVLVTSDPQLHPEKFDMA